MTLHLTYPTQPTQSSSHAEASEAGGTGEVQVAVEILTAVD